VVMSEEDAQQWRRAILAAPDDVTRDAILNQLREQDRARFLTLSRALATQPPLPLQDLGLRMLGYYGDPNDSEADRIARAQLGNPPLRKAALLALGTVAITSTFPTLLAAADNGDYLALRSVTKQARTPEQRRQVLQLARQHIMSSDPQLRIQAVWALRRLSTVVHEERLLVEAARRFPDELIFAALRHASPDVLPALDSMLDQFPSGSAQYHDIADAIQDIRVRHEQLPGRG
jgi:hypothetical protein